jgi:hypothetical protein
MRATDTKMGAEIEGTLMHADAPHRGNATHSVPREFVTLYNRFPYEIILAGATHAD